MSHFTRIRTQLREQQPLVQALRDLHHQVREGQGLVVRGYPNNTEHAEIVLDTGSAYDIGFQRRQQAEYEIVADWWGVERNTPLRQSDFVAQVARQYAYNVVQEYAREQYLLVEEEQVLDNGDVVILLSERG